MGQMKSESFKQRAEDWTPPEENNGGGPRTVEGIVKVTQNLPDVWQMSDRGREAISLATKYHQTKHGMYAAVPLICKGSQCPYAKTCPLQIQNIAPIGERCAMEIGQIRVLFDQYCRDLGVDTDSVVNLGLVKDLIDCHIMIARADALIAASGDIIEEVAVGVTDDGDVVTKPELSKALEVKERYTNLKTKILNQLNATPKDKAGDKGSVVMDPSKYAAELMRRKEALKRRKTIEAEIVEGD